MTQESGGEGLGLNLLGFDTDYYWIRNHPFLSSHHISNYDLFVLPNSSVVRAFDAEKNGVAVDKFRLLQHAAEVKLKQLLKYCEAGASIIVPVASYFEDISVVQKGGAVIRFDTGKLPIFDRCEARLCSGAETEFLDEARELRSLKGLVTSYYASLEGPDLIPLMIAPSKIKGDEKVIAAYARPFAKGGVILFCPPFAGRMGTTHPSNVASSVLNAWCAVALRLSKAAAGVSLPEWVTHYDLAPENDSKRRIAADRATIQTLQNSITDQEAVLAGSEWQKHLLTENDDPLEDAVKNLFEKFDFRVEKGPRTLADLIAVKDELIVCMEVKGYEGAVKDSAISQCSRWVADVEHTLTLTEDRDDSVRKYADVLRKLGIESPLPEGGPMPYTIKGLVVANTYRKQPLAERPDLTSRGTEHFAEVQQRRMLAKGIAGVTTSQLLGYFDSLRSDPTAGLAKLTELLGSSGFSSEYSDWRKFLRVI